MREHYLEIAATLAHGLDHPHRLQPLSHRRRVDPEEGTVEVAVHPRPFRQTVTGVPSSADRSRQLGIAASEGGGCQPRGPSEGAIEALGKGHEREHRPGPRAPQRHPAHGDSRAGATGGQPGTGAG